ncbi:MAG: sulfatase-like hydrolase/transferase [Bacteroidales bacterium]|nr:sulfatase-like hydrolase/transferase [Bacteroidales bacterium]
MNRKTSLSFLTILILVIITIAILVNTNRQVLNPESRIPTPNMDQLAAEGMHFTDVHSYSGVCMPTRYGVLTRIVLNNLNRF